MLVLSRKCDERIVLPDVILNVVEISESRVRLGLMPTDGKPMDPRKGEANEEVVPEVRFTERGFQMLVWADQEAGLRINERVEVRVISVDPERVSLGIVALRDETTDVGGTPVAPEKLSAWIARKITTFLKDRPRGALKQLAEQAGVSQATISRWRRRQTNVASEHLRALLAALNVSLDDLAAELGVERVTLPEVRTRGPAPRG